MPTETHERAVGASQTAPGYAGRVGLLMPVEHATRIDAPRACRLVRALGAAWVRAAYRPRGREQIDRVLAALVPDREDTTVSFDGGLALDELEPVAFGGGTA